METGRSWVWPDSTPGPHREGEEPKPMTNGPKKSDLAKVAGKPTNKAGIRTAAEPVEPRAGAEGNVSQQSTYRTQCRDRVSQALERVRQAARARKKERFTALLHHVNIDLLRLSFYALKRSEEHTSELQSLRHLVCRLLLEK